MRENIEHHEPACDRGSIRMSWLITLSAIALVVAGVLAVYGTHAFTILGRLGVSLT